LIPSDAAAVPPRQPAGSRIQLHKSEQTFQVVIPARQTDVLVLLFSAIVWNSVIVSTFSTSTITWVVLAPFPENLLFGLFMLLCWTTGLGMVGRILYRLFGKVHLRIDTEYIRLAHEVFGLRFRNVPPSRRWDIDRLELIPRRIRRDSDGNRVEVSPQLNIWAGIRKYELKDLQEPELEWLAAELSRWLKIPVERQKV